MVGQTIRQGNKDVTVKPWFQLTPTQCSHCSRKLLLSKQTENGGTKIWSCKWPGTYLTTAAFCSDYISTKMWGTFKSRTHAYNQKKSDNRHTDTKPTCRSWTHSAENFTRINLFIYKFKKGKENRYPPPVFLFTQLSSLLSSISLRTAGPATGRMTNRLCHAASQMALTLSWRVLWHFLSSNTKSLKYWIMSYNKD